jgi:hypothetical protein
MRQKTGRLAAAAALVLLFPVLALAQVNSVRGPLQGPLVPPGQRPVRLEIRDNATAQAKTPAETPAPDQAPAKTPAPAKAADEAARPSKFPNIDTAKNRQDYEMSTPKAQGIRLGRDEDTGDTVMGSTPPKKKQAPDPYANTPIEVRPIIPVHP